MTTATNPITTPAPAATPAPARPTVNAAGIPIDPHPRFPHSNEKELDWLECSRRIWNHEYSSNWTALTRLVLLIIGPLELFVISPVRWLTEKIAPPKKQTPPQRQPDPTPQPQAAPTPSGTPAPTPVPASQPAATAQETQRPSPPAAPSFFASEDDTPDPTSSGGEPRADVNTSPVEIAPPIAPSTTSPSRDDFERIEASAQALSPPQQAQQTQPQNWGSYLPQLFSRFLPSGN